MTIQSLIDKQDTVEIVRDQIGAILVTEVASQMAKAITAGKDPEDWRLRIFSERSNPWEIFPIDEEDKTPIVNVWWETSGFDMKASNTIERQKSDTVFNIDCYGYGVSSGDGTGHVAGDQEAAKEAHRAVRLVRNILMASEYAYLALRGTVWGRMVTSISIFQPQQVDPNVNQIVGARLSFKVSFNEFSPQYEGEILELINVIVNNAETGQLLLEADYPH